MSDRIEAIRARWDADPSNTYPSDVGTLLDAYRHMVESWETLEDVKAEALEHAADEANRRREKYLESPSLSMDWVAGWHAAVDDVTATLRALAPAAPDAEPTEWEWSNGDVVLWCDGDVWQRVNDSDTGVWYDAYSNHVNDEHVTAEVTNHGAQVLVCKARGIGVGGASRG